MLAGSDIDVLLIVFAFVKLASLNSRYIQVKDSVISAATGHLVHYIYSQTSKCYATMLCFFRNIGDLSLQT